MGAGTTLHQGPTASLLVIGDHRTNILIDRRSAVVAVSAGVVVLGLMILALLLGDFPLTIGEMVDVFLGRGEGLARMVVFEWRLPRAIAAVLFGAALGVSGALFQTITRNPLASPDIMGLANGSYTGMILALVVLGGSWPMLVTGSLVGGLAAAAVIYLLALRGGLHGFRFIMVGIGREIQPVIGEFREKGILVGRPFPPMTQHMRVSIGPEEDMGKFLTAFKQIFPSRTATAAR